jgi:hypothetical protein
MPSPTRQWVLPTFRSTVAALVVLALAAFAAPAVAAPPPDRADRVVHETFAETDVVDEFLTELCGTTITITFRVRVTTVFFEQPFGDESSAHQHLARFSGTLTGPGGTLVLRSANRELVPGDGTVTVTGLPFRIFDPDGGILIRDAGFVTFDEDGDPVVVHGPHPSLFEDFNVCSYLV